MLGLLAGALPGTPGLAAVAAAGPAAPTAPDIVLIVTDDQSADAIPHDPPVMPLLQARLDDPSDHWVQFPNTFTNTPLCCPARASLLSGLFSHHHGVQTNGDAAELDDSSTVATWLDDAGYRTALLGKYLNGYPFGGDLVPPGWDRWAAVAGSETKYFDYTLVEDGVPVTYGSAPEDYQTDVLGQKAAAFVRSTPAHRQLFLMFTPQSPHEPRTPAPRHEGLYEGLAPVRTPAVNEEDVSDKPAWVRDLPLRSEDWLERLDRGRQRSFEALASVDEAVEGILVALEETGRLERTIVVVMSDNGFAFGEHRWRYKLCAYTACTQTPLLVRVPGAEPRVDERLVSHVDVAPTIADLAGVVPETKVDGRSLAPALSGGGAPWRTAVLLEWRGNRSNEVPGYWAIRTRSHLYVALKTGERELYDLTGTLGEADPFELENRVARPAYAELRRELAQRLTAMRTAAPRRLR